MISYGAAATRDNPQRTIVSFQVGSADTQAKVFVTASSGNIEIHSLTLRENALSDPGFERTTIGVEEPWFHEPSSSEALVTFDMTTRYAGVRSACLDSEQAPAVFVQEPTGMKQENLYLLGAQLNWESGVEPTIHVADGSLFASGSPYSDGSKAIAQARDVLGWQSVATVARRLLDATNSSGLNNVNDFVRFGTGDETGTTKFCVDSTYIIELERIQGSYLTQP